MAISVGDKIPSASFRRLGANGMEEISTDEFFSGKKVVVFSVPGAFTPTCSAKHLPGFIQQADAFKAKGVDAIACTAVNDAFVMKAWGESQGAGDKVTMLADGNADFVEKLGLGLDASGAGLGKRGKRFAMVVDDGVVTRLAVEEPGQFDVSSAESVLKSL